MKKDADSKDITLARRLFIYVRRYPVLLISSFVLYPLNSLCVILPPLIVQHILDVSIPAGDWDDVLRHAGYYALALVAAFAIGFASQFAMSVLGQRAMHSMRDDLFRHVQKLPASYYDRTPIGRTLTRLTNDVEALAEAFATGAVTILGDIITVLFILGTMLWLSPTLTLYAFMVVPLLVILVSVFRRFARKAFRSIRKTLSRINSFLSEHISGMTIVQSFRQEERTLREFQELNESYRRSNHRAIQIDALLYSVVEALGVVAVAVVVWGSAPSLSTATIGAGVVVAFIQYIQRAFIPIRDLSSKYTVLQSAFAAAERCFELLDEPITIENKPGAKRIQNIGTGIELRDVWFSYVPSPEDEDWVLRDLSLDIPAGKTLALVGATGSGKTSFIKLLNRSYDIQQGSIAINKTPIQSIELASLRRLFAVVLQDVFLFRGTIEDNLRFGDRVSRDAMIHAAEAVQASTFIDQLPDGYQTEVLEGGSNFSSGERQLLAFARALALDPDVLLLDEATSAVDTETEAKIQAALKVLTHNRTSVVVAHRLSTIREADQIAVLQRGRLAELGNHATLLEEGGLYAQLVELQFGQAAA